MSKGSKSEYLVGIRAITNFIPPHDGTNLFYGRIAAFYIYKTPNLGGIPAHFSHTDKVQALTITGIGTKGHEGNRVDAGLKT